MTFNVPQYLRMCEMFKITETAVQDILNLGPLRKIVPRISIASFLKTYGDDLFLIK
jgi:hypothetical protein